LGPAVWRLLAQAHELRNEGEYEGQLKVTEQFLAELILAAKAVLAALEALPPLA
jgi:hypothetical protein